MTLRGTFRRKSLKTVRFLHRANTTLGHEKENVVQFPVNEFFGLFHSPAEVWNEPAWIAMLKQRDMLVRSIRNAR